MTIDDRRRSGRSVVTLLALLLLLVGLGGFNYVRNLKAEEENGAPRPFERYETADLEALRDAYAKEVDSYQKRYNAQSARRQRASGTGLMDQRVREFERVQQSSDRLRDLRTELAEREARLREVDAELQIRASAATGWALHLKRLVTI